ncbi:non-ribosomal peptide synthetase [Neolewinella litorea]|uniref:Amino acid adenylation domain-containing protein n=1 Tax=Neolewinella litorea TaxID=2562452 RepID=A0A4S4N6Z9_9BACT|nr:non-ribosomal peptide synthetase [Neolewinella litorea]THH34926.1 amino acid adenylation domain-containing protein [Neolewinella litorea]
MSQGSLLSKWLNRSKVTDPPAAAEEKGGGGIYPLSRGQERLYFLAQAYPGNPFYNYAERVVIDGRLDRDLLRTCFEAVATRQEMLRTTFTEGDDGPRQVVGPDPLLSWEVREMPDSEEAARSVMLENARQPFDLAHGPLTRLLLLRKTDSSHVLIITQHHILTDKTSMQILLEEVAREYDRRIAGREQQSAPLKVSYGAYALRQRERAADRALDYWKTQLQDVPTVLALPTDRPRPREQRYRGAYASGKLTAELSARVRESCRESGVTPYVYLLSAYLLMLHRYGGQADLLVGTPVTNRDTLELERLIGFFNETVLIRSRLKETVTFTDWVAEVKATMLDALEHRNAPFEAIVRELNPVRLPGTNPLFQAMFILHHGPGDLSLTEGVRMRLEPLDLGVSKFDLTLFVADSGEEFSTIFEYATDLFEADRIERLTGHLTRILEQVTRDPRLRVGEIDLVPAPELELLRHVSGSAEAAALPPARFLDDRIAEVARHHPTAPAVACGTEQLTYAELERRANALAFTLQQRGMVAGAVVALHVGRGIDTVVGLLGILRAGGAYLPLDPEYPAERRSYMLDDSGARWLVGDGSLSDFAPGPDVDVIRLDALDGAEVQVNSRVEGRSLDDPAYLIYTSGSSGRPKGIAITHHQLASSTDARAEVYGGGPAAFLLLSSFSFDSSVAGIFWTLTTGGKLVVAPARAEQDMEGLARLIAREGITHSLLLPTLYDHLVDLADPELLQSLETVIVAGEACAGTVVERHFARLPATALYNEYGPTEATVWATVHRLTAGDAAGGVPIGRPIPGAEVHLITPNGRLAPLGVPGELCIAGAGVADGYWHRPALTAEKFTPLQLPDGASVRVYRTGDRATYRADGNLLYLGRMDRQVKIRGHRVELEEIRNHLLQLDGVGDAEVRISDGGQLLGYLLTETDPDLSALRQELLEQLPAYLVPARLLRLEAFPRLPNGKVDIQALPDITPDDAAPVSEDKFAAPATATETTLLEIWRELLGTRQMGVTDNFFSLGGDSILSIQLLARARRAGLQFSPTAVFDRQTIRALAAVARPTGPETETEAFSGPVPLTPIQEWFFEEHQAAPHHWNHAWRLQLPGPVDPAGIADAIEAIASAHGGLRQNFSRESLGWRATIRPYHRGEAFQHFSEREGGEAAQLARIQTEWKLESDPLFRALLFTRSETGDGATLYLLAHHLVIDMVSWQTILHDLAGHLRGEAGSGQPTGASFHRWPQQLDKWASEKKFEEDLSFWQQQATTALPTELPGSLPVKQATVATVSGRLGEAATRDFLQSANEAYGTRPEELLLAALLRTLASYTGSGRQCLNLERHGREPLDSGLPIEETPGWFTVSYPLTFAPGSDADPREAIVAVKEQLRAVPNKGLGYGVLRYLARQPGLEQSPAVYFNYLGQQDNAFDARLGTVKFVRDGLRHPNGEVNRVWEINAAVEEGQLTIYWSYSTSLHYPATVAGLVDACLRELTELLDHCRTVDEPVLTPSDFPDSGLDQSDLEGLLGELNL